MSKTYKSKILASVHETASDLHEAGLMNKKTMREFDNACLTQIEELSAEEIKEIRAMAQVSQTVFARYLNVSPGIVSKWERGEKQPTGASLKLLTVIRKKGLEAIA
jgi:putative transcriptional regulator